MEAECPAPQTEECSIEKLAIKGEPLAVNLDQTRTTAWPVITDEGPLAIGQVLIDLHYGCCEEGLRLVKELAAYLGR